MSYRVASNQADVDAMFPSEAILASNRRELEVFIGLLNNPYFVINKVNIFANPDDGVAFAKFIKKNADDVYKWVLGTSHKMLDNGGLWCNGGFGSRWADIKVGGRTVRLAFYSKQTNKKFYGNVPAKKPYALMICEL